MNQKNVFLFSLFFFLSHLWCASFVMAQTAALLETVYAAEAVTCAQASAFALGTTADAGYAQAVEKGWLKEETKDEPITMKQLSHLLTQAFEIKGGFMQRLAKSPRYAYRTMVSRGFIQGASDPKLTVSGEKFLQIYGKVLAYTDELEAAAAEKEAKKAEKEAAKEAKNAEPSEVQQ